jgi:alpha-L-fucosidase
MIAPSYARTVARFQPNPGVVDGWFGLARRAGARYVAITAKHHDGYALWNSSTTSYGVGRRDLIARAALDARRSGLGLVLYFSLVDKHVPSYEDDWPAYLQLAKVQLRELLTRYGPIAGVWFDGPGWADRRSADEWGLPSLYAEVHRYQPDAEIITNHHCARPLAGEAALTFETRLPRRHAAFPQQIAYSLSDQWFYSTQERPRSRRFYLALRARARSVRAGLLINVPPRPDGTFAPGYVRALLGR